MRKYFRTNSPHITRSDFRTFPFYPCSLDHTCRPHLEYCSVAWSPHYQKEKSVLERVQHRFTRLMPGMAAKEYSNRLEELRLWSLEERRNCSDQIEVFKMSQGLSGVAFDSFFEVVQDHRTRGHSLKLAKHRSRLDLRQHFFSERVVD